MTIEHLLSALIARGLPSRPPTFSIPYTGAQLSSRYLVPLSTRCTVVYPDGCAGIDAVCIGEVIIPKGRVILSILIANTIVLKPPAASDVTVEREAAEPDEMVVHMLLE